jgi:hypothetical protein
MRARFAANSGLDGRICEASGRIYQPQQSVLNPQAGQRHTACMRYISAWPHRSQIIASSDWQSRRLVRVVGVSDAGCGSRGAGVGRDIGEL